jgi:hypothetical protein
MESTYLSIQLVDWLLVEVALLLSGLTKISYPSKIVLLFRLRTLV